ncbi:hypothetical protein LEM8419_02239 [Neolewinella maritima]|uniref:O-antigen ligase domain-containing protein n=1 Tax=Neolewinella maritima TaxID=1383882 RepID=A0ABN8F2Y5_9BACT|nr:hypothetical protein [Neolewinella maritima]CAH1001338.1 hypothetical protein LEM8419_02239 [Neolewinella maritima]
MQALYPRNTHVELPDYVQSADRLTRRLIYLYIFLLFFEGGLRKWILPGLSTPLLIIRDPLMLVIIGAYWSAGRRLLNAYTLPLLVLGVLSFFLSIAFAHGNLYIGLFGLRTLLLHFFLLFIMGNVFTREHVETVGRYIIYLLPVMTLLIGLQFYSPQSAWVNRGIGGDMEGSGFNGAMGYLRPSGTYSFTTGLTTFYGLAAAYVFYFLGALERISKLWLLIGFLCLLAAIPLSISRSYFFQFLICIFFFVIASLRSGRSVRNLGIGVALTPLLAAILYNFEFIQTGVEVLVTRFELASKSEGGLEGTLGDRFLGGLIGAFTGEKGFPWYGAGLGLGTNVGASLYGRANEFVVAEEEWKRVAGEMGPFLGIPVILLRVILGAHLSLASLRALLTRDNALPFMLLSFSLLQVLQAAWASPTTLGFSILAGGLTIASLNDSSHAA